MTSREAADGSNGNSFGTVSVPIVDREAKKIAAEKKAGDLPAPVRQQLVQFYGPGGDIEQIHRRIAFTEDRLMRIDALKLNDLR